MPAPTPPPAAVVRVRATPADPQKYAVAVAASRIDGQGAFAAQAVPARRKIGEIRGEPISVREARRRAKGALRIMIVELSRRSEAPMQLRSAVDSIRGTPGAARSESLSGL